MTADALLTRFTRLPGVVIAYSGGIDSTVVAAAAYRALGEQAIAITADSPSVPRSEIAEAKRIAAHIGIRHEIVSTTEFTDPAYLRNDAERCYRCKTELYGQLTALLPRFGMNVIMSGATLDDLGDYRPGLRAAAEHGVRHPLQEAGFRKADVRALAKEWGLPTWDKPASPCLSSRLAPGVAVTTERTARIESAEAYLHAHGFRECRVRLHEGELARIEVPLADWPRLSESAFASATAMYFKSLGFRFVTFDPEGFRTGNLNTLLNLGVRPLPSARIGHNRLASRPLRRSFWKPIDAD